MHVVCVRREREVYRRCFEFGEIDHVRIVIGHGLDDVGREESAVEMEESVGNDARTDELEVARLLYGDKNGG